MERAILLLHMLISAALAVLRAAKGLAAENGAAEEAKSRIFQFMAFGRAAALCDFISEGVEMPWKPDKLENDGMTWLEVVID